MSTTSKPLQKWLLAYGEDHLLFECDAEDIRHAIEQCENAYPNDTVQSAMLSKDKIVAVQCWDSTHYGNEVNTDAKFEIGVTDQRHTSGQIYVDITALAGPEVDLMYLALEINRLPECTVDRQCAHLHFDNDKYCMGIFKDGDGYILRPETGVTLRQHRLPNGEYAYRIDGS